MNTYITQGRFGEFVHNILDMDMKRKSEAARKEDIDMLCQAYISSIGDKALPERMSDMMKERAPVLYAMSSGEVNAVKQRAKEIMERVSPV